MAAPGGVSSSPGIATERMPAPEYPRNANGQTYGSAADAPAPGAEPDLILVMATNGIEGYVQKAELDDANGSAAAETFTSPEQALAWQEANSHDRYVPVYDRDGERVIGEFLIAGLDSWRAVPDEAPLD
ncbi:hypothetical protein [Agromyces rhizosphaerae]|uniref:hypothetical protein n=1 Tax=Agromyces rhizosphaerae TaxID=88374 RepID=UPI0024909A3C|nr:hypothetical protein [Agromyces rhizosphaerae]